MSTNYGWPMVTWGHRYDAIPMPAHPEPEGPEQDTMERPVANWSPSPAVSAIAFYEGKAFPRRQGNLLVGSMTQIDLFRIVLDGNRLVLQETILHGVNRIRNVRVGPDGYVYVLTDAGQLLRLVPVR